jgi:hypothetical protein
MSEDTVDHVSEETLEASEDAESTFDFSVKDMTGTLMLQSNSLTTRQLRDLSLWILNLSSIGAKVFFANVESRQVQRGRVVLSSILITFKM